MHARTDARAVCVDHLVFEPRCSDAERTPFVLGDLVVRRPPGVRAAGLGHAELPDTKRRIRGPILGSNKVLLVATAQRRQVTRREIRMCLERRSDVRESGRVGRPLRFQESQYFTSIEAFLGQDRDTDLHRTEHPEDQPSDPEEGHGDVHPVAVGPAVPGRDESRVPQQRPLGMDHALGIRRAPRRVDHDEVVGRANRRLHRREEFSTRARLRGSDPGSVGGAEGDDVAQHRCAREEERARS